MLFITMHSRNVLSLNTLFPSLALMDEKVIYKIVWAKKFVKLIPSLPPMIIPMIGPKIFPKQDPFDDVWKKPSWPVAITYGEQLVSVIVIQSTLICLDSFKISKMLNIPLNPHNIHLTWLHIFKINEMS